MSDKPLRKEQLYALMLDARSRLIIAQAQVRALEVEFREWDVAFSNAVRDGRE